MFFRNPEQQTPNCVFFFYFIMKLIENQLSIYYIIS